MRIPDSNASNNLSASELLRSQGVDDAARRERQTAKSPSGENADTVSLSSLGTRLRELAIAGPERASRVEQLAAEYRAGNYHVDARQLSRGLVNDALARGAAASSSE